MIADWHESVVKLICISIVLELPVRNVEVGTVACTW